MQADSRSPEAREHFAHVSIREITGVSASGRQEIRHNLDAARGLGMGIVQIIPGGIFVPAAVTLRTTVNQQVSVGPRIRDNWHVVFAPSDSEGLMRRLFAERNKTMMGAIDAPVAGMVEASYDAVRALNKAHDQLSKLGPPRIGTFVEMTFGFTRDVTSPVLTFHPSSVDVIRRARGWARHRNDIEELRWQAEHFPFNGPISAFGRQIWPWWSIPEPTYEIEPEIPEKDPWEMGGDLYEALADIIGEHFLPILESLWKAAFKQDTFVSKQLREQGFNLDVIEATRLGIGSLPSLMGRFRGSKAHMTMMADPDIVAELGDEWIRRMTYSGNTNYSVVIEED